MSRTKPVTDQELAEAIEQLENAASVIREIHKRLQETLGKDITGHTNKATVLCRVSSDATDLAHLILCRKDIEEERERLKKELEQAAGKDTAHV